MGLGLIQKMADLSKWLCDCHMPKLFSCCAVAVIAFCLCIGIDLPRRIELSVLGRCVKRGCEMIDRAYDQASGWVAVEMVKYTAKG